MLYLDLKLENVMMTEEDVERPHSVLHMERLRVHQVAKRPWYSSTLRLEENLRFYDEMSTELADKGFQQDV